MTTLHYLDRAFERANLGIDGAETFARNAYEKGKHAAQMPKYEREYMELKDATGKCITVYSAPEWFCRKHTAKITWMNKPKARIKNRYDGFCFSN